MSENDPMKAKQFIKKLREAGVAITESRGKGGHQLAIYGDHQTTVPFHGDKDLGPVLMKRICKQLGLNPEEVL